MIGGFHLTSEDYLKREAYLRSHPALLRLIRTASRVTDIIGYAAYGVLLIFLAASNDPRFLRCLIVPAVTFLITTAVRSGINAPRPYEKYNIKPLIEKNTKGKSFPSRHVSCIVIISAAWLYVFVPAGIFMCFVSLIIMVIRPLTAIHFPRDVIAGAILSAACGVIGFLLI